MADPLYLSLWFPGFSAQEMLPRALSVLRQFPYSTQRAGITYLAVHPVSWNEPTVLEQRFKPGVAPEEAILAAAGLLHEDYAYLFEAFWDLWIPAQAEQQWTLQPSQAKFLVHGLEFDASFEQDGHIAIDFGADTPFLHEDVTLTPASEAHLRANVQKLVEFTGKAEKNSGASGRLLWSASEESLAQKLIARLQKVQ